MGSYTAWDDPQVDTIVQDHLDQIVAAILERVQPLAIILRGSFSQGEGSVIVQDGQVVFLSDYELVAVTPHYRDRSWLQHVTREMTRRLGVETSISRVHPENIVHNSLGNTPIRHVARPSIAMYEMQQGGRTLYGQDYRHLGPTIHPADLDIWVGLRLLLNRMAESLSRLARPEKDWDELRWINKTLLSCAEAILILHGEYHYSYAGRRDRFARLVTQLNSVTARAPLLPGLVDRATAFKLCPSPDLYPEPLPVLWRAVRQACDATLRHIVDSYLGISFESYAEFPSRYLNALNSRPHSATAHLKQNFWLGLRLLREHRVPPLALYTHLAFPAYQTVYSVVPLVLFDCSEDVLREARTRLGQVMHMQRRSRDGGTEWEYLRSSTARAWHDLCYGLWDTLEL